MSDQKQLTPMLVNSMLSTKVVTSPDSNESVAIPIVEDLAGDEHNIAVPLVENPHGRNDNIAVALVENLSESNDSIAIPLGDTTSERDDSIASLSDEDPSESNNIIVVPLVENPFASDNNIAVALVENPSESDDSIAVPLGETPSERDDSIASLSDEDPSESNNIIVVPLVENPFASDNNIAVALVENPSESNDSIVVPLGDTPSERDNSITSPLDENPSESNNIIVVPLVENPSKNDDSITSLSDEDPSESNNIIVVPLVENPFASDNNIAVALVENPSESDDSIAVPLGETPSERDDSIASLSDEDPSESNNIIVVPLVENPFASDNNIAVALVENPSESNDSIVVPLGDTPSERDNSITSPLDENPSESNNIIVVPLVENPSKNDDSITSLSDEDPSESNNIIVVPLVENPFASDNNIAVALVENPSESDDSIAVPLGETPSERDDSIASLSDEDPSESNNIIVVPLVENPFASDNNVAVPLVEYPFECDNIISVQKKENPSGCNTEISLPLSEMVRETDTRIIFPLKELQQKKEANISMQRKTGLRQHSARKDDGQAIPLAESSHSQKLFTDHLWASSVVPSSAALCTNNNGGIIPVVDCQTDNSGIRLSMFKSEMNTIDVTRPRIDYKLDNSDVKHPMVDSLLDNTGVRRPTFDSKVDNSGHPISLVDNTDVRLSMMGYDKCDFCSRMSTYSCSTCYNYYCNPCLQQLHPAVGKYTTHLVELVQLSPRLKKCSTHGEPARYHCHTCQEWRCYDCLIIEERCSDHDMELVVKDLRAFKKDLLRVLDDASNESMRTIHKENLLDEKAKLEMMLLLRKEEVRQEFVSFHDFLMEAESEIMGHLDKEYNDRKAYLDLLDGMQEASSNTPDRFNNMCHESSNNPRISHRSRDVTSSVTCIAEQMTKCSFMKKYEERRDLCKEVAKETRAEYDASLPPTILHLPFSLYREKVDLRTRLHRWKCAQRQKGGDLCFKQRTVMVKALQPFPVHEYLDSFTLPTSTTYVCNVDIKRGGHVVWSTRTDAIERLCLNTSMTFLFSPGQRYMLRIEPSYSVLMSATSSRTVLGRSSHMMICVEEEDIPFPDRVYFLGGLTSYEEQRHNYRRWEMEHRYNLKQTTVLTDLCRKYPCALKFKAEPNEKKERIKKMNVKCDSILDAIHVPDIDQSVQPYTYDPAVRWASTAVVSSESDDDSL